MSISSEPEFPLSLHDVLCIHSAFPIPTPAARQLLPADVTLNLNLVEAFPGTAVIVLTLLHYRLSSVVLELSLSLMATPEPVVPMLTLARLLKQSRYPAFALATLVNSQQTRQMSREILGSTPLLADLRLDERAEEYIAEADIDGQRVVRLVVAQPPTERTRAMQIESYRMQDGRLFCTTIRCQAQAYASIKGGGAILSWGSHPLTKPFAGMGRTTEALMMRYYKQMQLTAEQPQEYHRG